MYKPLKFFALAMLGLPLLLAGTAMAAPQQWELINPKGIAGVEPINIIPHNFDTLNGKTVVLHINGKHNADNFQDRIAEMLLEQFPQINIIKRWVEYPDMPIGGTNIVDGDKRHGEAMLALKPDLVISAQAD